MRCRRAVELFQLMFMSRIRAGGRGGGRGGRATRDALSGSCRGALLRRVAGSTSELAKQDLKRDPDENEDVEQVRHRDGHGVIRRY
ncbi:hypothetical protein EVAR_50048_1 [Eumeta japonica]|uniref:Uncharacterized protein n=1 Tax=Eumeta variegata TaxID=151549 RepID=A0A4C1XJB9_EUMVA|nr:hypothetical protein EVAR_50048_1 [Eumeta japonica]